MFLKANGIVQHVKSEGQNNQPVLVLVNSLGGDLRIWDDLVGYFASDFRIIRYDQRGHGLTDAPPPPYAMDDFVFDLMGLLDALEIREATVCGISLGGVIAQGLALRSPDRVRGLVLCDTAMRIGSFDSWEERIATVKTSGLAKLVNFSMERWFAAAFREKRGIEMQGYANMLLRVPPDGYLGTCYALRDADLTQSTPKINQPTLVLCGDQDVATPPDLGRALAQAIAEARFAMIENAGHLICIEQPAVMAQRMTEFFHTANIG